MAKIPPNIQNAINEFVNGLNKIFGNKINKIILYGSYARGDYRENSDLDIMILTDMSEEDIVNIRTEVWDFAYDVGLSNDIMISALIKNINDFNYWIDTLPFYMNIQKEGVIING